MDRVRHVDRLQDEERRVEEDGRQQYRPQQRVPEDQHRPFSQVVQKMARRRRRPRRLAETAERHDGPGRQRGRDAERDHGAGPADERAAERRPRREGGAARQLHAPVRRGQRLARDERGHESRRGHAIGDGAGGPDRSQERQQRQRQQVELGEGQDGDERGDPQPFGRRHEAAPRHAIGQDAGGNRQQQERQRLRGLQEPRLAGSRPEREHGDDRRGGEADLLGRLRGQVGPRQAVECGGQSRRGSGGRGHRAHLETVYADRRPRGFGWKRVKPPGDPDAGVGERGPGWLREGQALVARRVFSPR